MQKFFFLFFLSAICFSLNACGWQESQRIKALEKSCSKLSLVTGKQYEAIWGQYSASELKISEVVGNGSDGIIINLPVIVDQRKIKVVTSVSKDKRDYLWRRLYEVFSQFAVKENINTYDIIGICITRSKYLKGENVYVGDFETLVNISHGNYEVDIIDEPNYEEFNTLKNGSSK